MKKILLTFMLALMAITAQALTEFTVGPLKYYIETNGNAYCNGLAASAGNPTTITIPGRVTYNGTTYYVTNIATNAFKNNTTLKQVRVGWGVQQIGSASFLGCTALEYVWLPSSVRVMYNQAFQGCTSMLQFQIAAPTPPVLYGDKTFYNMKKCDVIVAMRSDITAYSNSSQFVDADKNGSISASGYAANDFINNGVAWVITNENITDINVNVTMVGISSSLTYLPMSSSTTDYTNATYGNGTSMQCNWTEIASYAAYGRTSLKTIGRSDMGSYFRLDKVGPYAFHDCTGLTEVNISAAEIGESAFRNCTSLATVNLFLQGNESYGTQKLGTQCFANTAVSSVYIPQSMTYYGIGAFAYCSNLTKFNVASGNTYFATDANTPNCLYNYNKTILYQMGAGTNPIPGALSGYMPNTLATIYSYAMAGTKLYTVDVPYGVKTISPYAFSGMENVQTIRIPSSVTTMYNNTFYGLSSTTFKHLYLNLKTIPSALQNTSAFSTLPSGVTLHVPLWRTGYYTGGSWWSGGWSSKFTGGVVEDSYDFSFATFATGTYYDYVLYYTVSSASSYTDTKVQSAATNGQLTVVRALLGGSGYFGGVINFPNTTEHRGKTYITTEVQREVFRNMTRIYKVTGGAGIKKIGALAFAGLTGCSGGFNIPYPVEFGDSALYNCKTPTITLGDRLQRIGQEAFRQTNITQLIMPNTVNYIGSRFVAGSSNLDTLRLSPNITNIPYQGLAGVNARYIVLPYGVKSIGAYAFVSDKFSIEDGESVAEIGGSNYVVIPSSVTSIDPNAFSCARHLEGIYLNCPYGVLTTVKDNWRRRMDLNASNAYDWSGHKLYVPVGQVQQYRNDPGIKAAWDENNDVGPGAFDFTYDNNFVGTNYRMTVVNPTLKTAKYVYGEGNSTNVILLSNTETDHNTGVKYTMVEIGDSAFVKHTAATHIYLDDATSLTRIGAHAFRGLTLLNQEVNVPESVSQIGSYAFYGCTKLPSVFLNRSSSTTSIGTYMFSTSQTSILYVPLNRMYSIAQQCPWLANTASNRRLLPYVKPTTEWSAISVPVSDNILLPSTGTFYYASSFNSGNYSLGKTQLSNSQGIKGGEGMLMKGTVGTVYRFRRNDAVSSYTYVSPSTNYLKGVTNAYSQTLTYSSSGPYYYTFDGTDKFNRVNSSATVYSGEAYVQTPSSYSNIYINSDITTYNLWINGTQVTDENCSNLKVINGVSGTTVSYSPTTNTLTLSGATITNSGAVGIRSEISGLTIKVIGTNNVTVTAGNHYALQAMQNTTITGTGTLNAASSAGTGGFVYTGKTLTVNGGVKVKFTGAVYGILGYSTTSRLIIGGATTKLTANGITGGSYYQLPTTMNDGLAITSPAGAYFNNGTVIYGSSVAKNIDVVISKPAFTRGDVDGSGDVSISDVTALIDYLLSGNASSINLSAADCDQDGSVTISDVTALIDHLLSGNW